MAVKIALDAAGGDFGLKPNIEGAVNAVTALGVEVLLVGPAQGIRSELAARGIGAEDKRFEIVDAPEQVAMDEDPAKSCKEKPHASIMVCAELVEKGKAQATISAGHSGAAMVSALWHLKRIPGVLRPAIASPIPTAKGTSILLDAGAITECKPWHLLQFAIMGSLYAKYIFKIEDPKIGILSNGEEESKGNELVRETIPLLKSSGLKFFGPIEGRDIPAGTVDVIVCDGFTGNICLKLYEGAASTLLGELKREIEKGFFSKLGGLLIRPAGRRLKKRMSYDEYGGAPLLGVGGTSIICHGKSNARAIFNAHRVAKELVEMKANEQIQSTLETVKSSMETVRLGEQHAA